MNAPLVSPEGLRSDGRRPSELRHMLMNVGRAKDGSSSVRHGNTRVLVRIDGPREHHKRDSKRDREEKGLQVTLVLNSTNKRDTTELEVHIARVLSSVIEQDPRNIRVAIHVLQQDGGLLHAALNASCLALMDAGVAMRDFCVSVAVSAVQGTR